MNDQIDFLAIMGGTSDINKIFQGVRIIEPQDNYVCELKDGRVYKSRRKCYCDLDKQEPCKNCIAQKAYTSQNQTSKIQYHNNCVEFIIAVPVIYQGEHYVLELTKDITDNMVIHDKYHPDNNNIYDLINELNLVSSMDPFTNLYNKKYVSKQLEKDIEQVKQTKEPYIVALVDIDNFKFVNDTFGHMHGDRVIQDVVQVIHKYTDDHNCWAARYGGDEFLLVFRGESMEDVLLYCENIQHAIGQIGYESEEGEYQISVTIGLHQFNDETDDYYSILENVDVKMYANKRSKI